jgi:hypothetical protein
MRVVSFKSVLEGVATRLGLEPSVNLERPQAAALTEYIQDKLEDAWELIPWPEWTIVEERQFRHDFSDTTSYVVGAEIYYETEDKYYQCILDSTGNLPTDTAFWEEATELDQYVARDQFWEDTQIGAVWAVYRDDPRDFRNPIKVGWWMSSNGIQIMSTALTKVWIEFGLHPPRFTSSEWDSEETYAEDDIVYYPITGQCYVALGPGANHVPTDTAFWDLQRFPYILAKHIKLAAVAEALKEDEAFDKATVQEGLAEFALSKAMDKESEGVRDHRVSMRVA